MIYEVQMTTIAEAVAEAMRAAGTEYTWFGHLDIWGEAYEKATGKSSHPMDSWQAVRNALSRSKLFEVDGYIKAASWSGREIRHPRFVLVEASLEEDHEHGN